VKRLRILVGDDHALIREGIRGLLESHCEVVGTAENGKTLVNAALETKPDLVVLDVSMPILNGIDAACEIKKALPSTRLVFLSMHANPLYLRKAIEAGASAYVLKSGAAEELLTGIREAIQGRIYVSPSFGQDVIRGVSNRRAEGARTRMSLTSRQRQVLQMVAEGKQNKEIAQIAHLSVRTVEFHRSRLMTRLGARSAAELTRFAIQEGLIDAVGN